MIRRPPRSSLFPPPRLFRSPGQAGNSLRADRALNAVEAVADEMLAVGRGVLHSACGAVDVAGGERRAEHVQPVASGSALGTPHAWQALRTPEAVRAVVAGRTLLTCLALCSGGAGQTHSSR